MANVINKTAARFFLIISLTGITITAYCWGVTGHRVVAEIAQNHLSKKARKELKDLIGRETLAEWANWPDFIKSDTTHTWDMASKWHYVNIPGNLSKDDFMKALKEFKGENLYTQIQEMMKELKDHSLDNEKRQVALRFLIHFIGDLHQPLHVGREEDQGGNKINVTWFEKPTNLHAVWDNLLVEEQQYSYTEYAKILDIASDEEENAITSSSLEDWFYESYELANKVYANVPGNGKLSYRYNYIFKDDLDKQLLKGGLRLAKVLNEVLE
jgi:hypothetical protein